MKTFKSFILETLSQSNVRYMPGRALNNTSSKNHIWKHDNEYGWHVRDPKGNVVYKSSETDAYKGREDVKSKATELDKK